jgi:WhiB family redox-sensing transcriptional regulator
LFFSDRIADIDRAKAICATCSFIDRCLELAIIRSEPCGVWGGQLFANGRILERKRSRGRPPKHPRSTSSAWPAVCSEPRRRC